MKKIIQNLLVPFAVVAMLSVGAFTVNASNTTDVTVVNENPEVQTPYEGELYYWDTQNQAFEEIDIALVKPCSFDVSSQEYIEVIDTKPERMYGLDTSTNSHRPLFLIE